MENTFHINLIMLRTRNISMSWAEFELVFSSCRATALPTELLSKIFRLETCYKSPLICNNLKHFWIFLEERFPPNVSPLLFSPSLFLFPFLPPLLPLSSPPSLPPLLPSPSPFPPSVHHCFLVLITKGFYWWVVTFRGGNFSCQPDSKTSRRTWTWSKLKRLAFNEKI